MNELAKINQKILAEGESLPSVTLQNGSKVQTGTFATLLHNISLYNALANESEERKILEQEMELAIRSLSPLGLFDLFSPQEWMNTNNPGRRRVGELAEKILSP